MEILMVMRVESILYLLQLIELKIQIQVTILWLQYERMMTEMLTKLDDLLGLSFQ